MKGDIIYIERRFQLWELKEILPDELLIWLKNKLKKAFFLFRHYGIDLGNERVIHFGGASQLLSNSAKIKEIFLGDFLLGSSGKKVDQLFLHQKFSPDMIVERAKCQLGTNFGGYDVLTNNCEHFAFWCATGKKISYQVPFIVIDNVKYKVKSLLGQANKEYAEKTTLSQGQINYQGIKYPNSKGIWFATLENFPKETRQATLAEIRQGK